MEAKPDDKQEMDLAQLDKPSSLKGTASYMKVAHPV